MARKKNYARRNIILNSAFTLIREHKLAGVSLQMIADDAGISKSLLQSYYPHKIELVNDILGKTMSTILEKLEEYGLSNTNEYAGMMVYISTILELGSKDQGLYNVLDSILSSSSSLENWAALIIKWMKKEDVKDAFGKDEDVLVGLTFVLSGGASLYTKREKFNLTAEEISSDMVTSFLSTFMHLSKKKIDQTMERAHEILQNVDITDVHDAVIHMFENEPAK